MAKTRLLTIPGDTPGTFVTIFSDGSYIKFNNAGAIVEQDDSPNPSRAAAAGAGDYEGAVDTIGRASAEDARRFDATLQIQQDTLKNNYAIALRNAKTQQDVANANIEYQRGQTELAKQRLAFDQRVSERDFGQRQHEYDTTLAQRQYEFNTNTGLQQAQLGYNLIGTGAQLRGPENYFQAAEYARGVSAQPGTSTFLSALQNNARLAGYGAQGGVPAPETVGSLMGKLGGTSTSGQNDGNYLAQIGNIGAKGAHQLGASSLEQLTPTEQSLFTSGLDKLGYDSKTFLDQYRRSRIGQSISGSRAA